MKIILRPGKPDDAQSCGAICYEAFNAISRAHNFQPDIPSPEVASGLLGEMLAHPHFYSVVAEVDGRTVGSNFMDERGTVFGIGPITVQPDAQNKSVGRCLMEDVMARAASRNAAGLRLAQAGYHARSLCLYTRLGFEVREPLACIQGAALGLNLPGREVRLAAAADLDACNDLCSRIHGHDRSGELLDAIHQGSASVVEYDGRLTGYTTSVAFFGHSIGETNADLQALIASAQHFAGPGFLLPIRNVELFRWCLAHGLRMIQPMTLMSCGLYNEPDGAFLPSVTY